MNTDYIDRNGAWMDVKIRANLWLAICSDQTPPAAPHSIRKSFSSARAFEKPSSLHKTLGLKTRLLSLRENLIFSVFVIHITEPGPKTGTVGNMRRPIIIVAHNSAILNADYPAPGR